jgi:hypothetical protein
LASLGSIAAKIGLVAWMSGVVVMGAALTALHEVPLPVPSVERAAPAAAFRIRHGLSAMCPCSQRVMKWLERRGAVAGVDEQVLILDGDEATAAPLRERGYQVSLVDDAGMAAAGIHAAPSLVIFRPDGEVAYAGAYAPRPQMDPIDLVLLDRARKGEIVASMPLLGCAMSRSLQERLDPLHLKYGR